MNNKQVAETFVNERVWGKAKVEGSNLFIEGRTIYSYGYHFPIAIRLEDNTFLLNEDGYSQTTAKHKGIVRREIEKQGFKLYILPTQNLKDIIHADLKTLKEVMLNKFIDDKGSLL